MSNNMYDILGKLASLEPKQKQAQTPKPLYESVEAKGSIVAGVKSVEQKLREQFDAMQEAEGKVYRHKGTYGNEYDPGDDAPKKPKHVPKKGVKGRPKKEQPASVTAPKGDIFGRTTGKVPKGKKGTEIKGKAMSHADNNKKDELDEAGMRNPYAIGMAQAKKEIGLGKSRAKNLPKKTIKRAHHIGDVISAQTNESRKRLLTQLSEGINFREMLASKDETLNELLSELQNDIKTFKDTGHCSDLLRDCMEVHGYGKQMQLNDAARGPSFAPQHPGTPEPKPSFLDKAKAFGHKALNTLGHGSDDELLGNLERETGGKRPNRYNENEDLNELARLAGLQVDESAKPDFRDVDDDGNEKESWKKAEKDKAENQSGEKVDECMSPIGGMAQEMQQDQGRISVNTSASSDGNKNITITADGDAAEQLMQMLKLAGMDGQHTEQSQHAEVVIAHEAKDYGSTDVEEAPEAMNKPRPDVRGAHRSETTGMANTSDDLHKQKDQHPDAAAKGDNPLTKKEKAVEDFNPLETLGAKLMQEYESIKISK